MVLIDAPSLNFGLLALGDSGVLQLPIRSETKAVLKYEVRQKVSHSQDNDYMVMILHASCVGLLRVSVII